ncbi:sensor histidine kinase [Sediminivirga luteola]|uniref:sensor histidine kinase n=1 Tax=Sediminivirga luteola TaxID=1774748 RepID=UPI001F56EB5C|nr:HAMP domain-containing sensor histidine kinase [Sediminivirga luteola]MCI2265955.1 HAMP domain-containing histidine kinase [Sediminivirga luteola]
MARQRGFLARSASSGQKMLLWEEWSLTRKLVSILVTLILLALLGTSAWSLQNLRHSLIERTDERLIQTSEALALTAAEQVLLPSGLASADDANAEELLQTLLPGQYYVQFFRADGTPVSDPVSPDPHNRPLLPRIDASLVTARNGEPFTVEGTGSNWRARVLTVQNTDFVVAIALPFEQDIDGITERARNTMIGIGIIALGLAGGVGYIIVTHTFRPLREIQDTAARIAAGDLSQRVRPYPRNTEMGRLAASLNTMLGKIERNFDGQSRSERRMRQFVADASHELRTPLVTIRGYAELYRQGAIAKPEDVSAAMRRIEAEALRLGALVDDLVALARLDEQQEVKKSLVDAFEIVRDAAADAAAQAPERDISLVSLDGGEAQPVGPVYGAESQLRQVIVNLSGNAIRHTPAGSPIEFAIGEMRIADQQPTPTPASTDAGQMSTAELRVRRKQTGSQPRIVPDVGARHDGAKASGRYVCIEIRDHGDGIAEEDIPRIFERFTRLDSSRNRDTGGSGLGLSIVRAIVERHAGEITVHQTEGGGATFRVLLPVADSPPAEAEDSAQHQKKEEGKP